MARYDNIGLKEAMEYLATYDRRENPEIDIERYRVSAGRLKIIPLDNYRKTEWEALNSLTRYCVEVLNDDDEWIPTFFNQETELDDEALLDWLLNLGDRADCQYDC